MTLADEKTRNSLSEGMIRALGEALQEAETDRGVSVIVIAAAGTAYCSGHNLKELTAHRSDPDQGKAYFEQIFGSCSGLMSSIATHRCAVVAEVDGLASAAGCQLVASCDLSYASPRAGFCTPGVNIGLFCSTPMVPLSRVVAPKHAMEMLLTGDVFGAEYALRAGLVNEVVPQNELRGKVDAICDMIASKSAAAIGVGKKAFHQQRALPLGEAYALSAAVMVQNMLGASAIEGIGAFIGKRPPAWPDQDR